MLPTYNRCKHFTRHLHSLSYRENSIEFLFSPLLFINESWECLVYIKYKEYHQLLILRENIHWGQMKWRIPWISHWGKFYFTKNELFTSQQVEILSCGITTLYIIFICLLKLTDISSRHEWENSSKANDDAFISQCQILHPFWTFIKIKIKIPSNNDECVLFSKDLNKKELFSCTRENNWTYDCKSVHVWNRDKVENTPRRIFKLSHWINSTFFNELIWNSHQFA